MVLYGFGGQENSEPVSQVTSGRSQEEEGRPYPEESKKQDGEVAQRLRHSLCKSEGWSSDPQHTNKPVRLS